jgi:DNA-binding transcriptional LysR family regulator
MLHSRLLGYLDEVARTGSIRKAAERVGIAASSINRQILALEEEFGVPIFERLPRRMRLTAAGELLLNHIRSTLREHERMRARLVDLQGRRRGIVRIATMGGLANTLMPPLVAWMRANYPYVKLVVRALPLEGVTAAVIAAEADIGLGYQLPADPKLRVLGRATARIGAVVAPGHALADLARPYVSLADCSIFPMVIPDRSLTVGALLADALERAAISVETVVETNSIELLKRAATQGQTVTFLSEVEMAVEMARGELVFLPLRDTELQQELRLVARRTMALDATQSHVAETLRQLLAESAISPGQNRVE